MESLVLHEACMNDEFICKYYKGIYARNELCFIQVEKPALYIVNTAHAFESYGHWIVLFISDNDQVEIFDSLAKELSDRHINIVNFVKRLNKVYVFSNKRIQSSLSTKCGWFCLYYAYFRCRNILFNSILNHFCGTNLELNDKIVIDFYRKQINSQFEYNS